MPPDPSPQTAPTRSLLDIWHSVEAGEAHTSLVVPSLSFDQGELSKIDGVSFYEERLLFTLMRLRNPRARVVYLTSQPIHPDIVDYYLHLLVGVPARHARDRLRVLCVFDGRSVSLTEKILERPRLVERLKDWIGDPSRAYLTCFNSTHREWELARRLGIPVNGVDPALLRLGTKSGSREVFDAAGVPQPLGFGDVQGEDAVLDALEKLCAARPQLRRAVIKLNDSFAGAGNALYPIPRPLPEAPEERRRALKEGFEALSFSDGGASPESFLAKMASMGGIVEEFLEAEEVRSPSVQMRITPNGDVGLLSSHDQVLGGPTGQMYIGCRFPADGEYRRRIQDEAMKIGRLLRDRGVVSRFAVDFLLTRTGDGPWDSHAIEINLRMGGTTPPFMALEFMTGGHLDPESGKFASTLGTAKYYFATDSLKAPTYRGLLPEDFLDILTLHGLHYRPASETGVLFHMIGALSEYGKVGVTCIGDTREEAEALYRRTVEILDHETDPERTTHSFLPAGDFKPVGME